MSRRSIAMTGALVLWVIILAAIFKVSLDRLEAPPWGNPTGTTSSPEVTDATRVGQQFSAPWPGLYRIDVTLDQVSAGASQQVTFHLKNDPGSDVDLWTATFESQDLQGPGVQSFEFPPVRGSKGQTYYFYLESAGSTTEDTIALGYGPGAMLEGATALVNDQPAAGNLQFNTYYSLRTRDRVGLLLAQLAGGRSYLLGSKAFYTGLAIVYGLVLVAFLWLATRAVLGEQKRT